MIRFTTLVGIDAAHVEPFKITWPTWKANRPAIAASPLLVFYDRHSLDAADLSWIDHGDLTLVPWPFDESIIHETQRERMLTGFVWVPSAYCRTPWYLKIDAKVVADPVPWYQEEWFGPDDRNRMPVFVTSPYPYTKPANQMMDLDRWATGIPELACHAPLNLVPKPGWSRVRHKRIASFVFYGRTDWTRSVCAYCDFCKLPVPSQDGYTFYCAARRGGYFFKTKQKRWGWHFTKNLSKLRAMADSALTPSPAKA